MLAGDVEVLDRLLDDDLVFLGPAGALATKAQDLENHRSKTQIITAHRPRDLSITLFGDDIAVASVVVELEGSFAQQAIAGTFRYLRTWRRGHEGAWRVIAGAVSVTSD